ncbi:tyrosine-type recombinase/integrase [Levilactobacillus bambusae]|uniref:Integrase n=1 Tax=Levilactobacillus bambusae TaxID=2024736 RepID=A0A2V1MZN2_9LACO|nr:tyrosine-type recombinase/integrase [Levilactobacillus bambusae]PWG00439.1 integrase [Levilactobacillus bambusae]
MHNNVEPLRTQREIRDFISAVSQLKFGKRNRLIVLMGINTGLNMSDLLALNVKDVRNKDQTLVTEQKTGRKRWLYLKNIRSDIWDYTQTMEPDEPIFMGIRGNRLTVKGVSNLFQRTAVILHRNDIGIQTLRKTFGYHYYLQNQDLTTLMTLFNQASEKTTRRYIGITQDTMEMKLKQFHLGI